MIKEEDMLSATLDGWLPPGPPGWWQAYVVSLQAEVARKDASAATDTGQMRMGIGGR